MSQWDVIVIGSGIGGLSAAAALAREGKRVLVVERHTQLGGLTQTFERNGYRFNVGVHYIGGAGDTDGHAGPAKKIFDVLTPHGIPMASMGPVYDRVHFPGMTIEFEHPAARLVETLKVRFPSEAAGIDRYFDSMRAAGKALEAVFAAHSMPQTRRARTDVVEGRRRRALGRPHAVGSHPGVRRRSQAAGRAGRTVGRPWRTTQPGQLRAACGR